MNATATASGRVVVKVGSSSLTGAPGAAGGVGGLDPTRVDALVDALAAYAVARRESGDATPPPKKSRRASSTTRTAR